MQDLENHKPLIERIKEAEGIFKKHRERLQPEVDKGYQTYESEAISYEDGQKILSTLTEARQFIEQASKPLEDKALEEDCVASIVTISMARGLAEAHGDFALDENLHKTFKTIRALHAHARRLEGENERLMKAVSPTGINDVERCIKIVQKMRSREAQITIKESEPK